MTGRRRIIRLLAVLAVIWAGLMATAAAQEAPEQEPGPNDFVIEVFPVEGGASFTDTWGAPRSGGRTHKGQDLFAPKGTPILAVADGVVTYIGVGELSGRYIEITHPGGWQTYYIHLDNDTPGTDDGLGGAPARGITIGASVVAGQVIDFNGDSGNAENTSPHLHFELHEPVSGEAINPYRHLRAALEGQRVIVSATSGTANQQPLPPPPPPPPPPEPETENATVVGNFDPGTGFAAGVSVHNATAYLGTWGRPDTCPNTGVRVIDVSDPENPASLGAIADADDFPRTSTDSVWVGAVDNEYFSGDLAVVAVRSCDSLERDEAGFRGLAFYDVTKPKKPKRLGRVASGGITQGVHEVDVTVKADGTVLVAATVMQSLLHSEGRQGDVRIVDATDPADPKQVADWDVRRDGIEGFAEQLMETREAEELHAHGVTFNGAGDTLWVAHWDAGLVLLDIENPAEPVMIATVPIDPAAEGNVHAVALDESRDLLVRTIEDLHPVQTERRVAGWGDQQLFRIGRSGNLAQLSEFMAEPAQPLAETGEVALDGYYSAHEAIIDGQLEYIAWYSAGVRIVDIADDSNPTEVGSFVPPASTDPTGHWKAPDGSTAFPMVWGVAADGELIYASDMHSGLWIIRYEEPADDTGLRPAPGAIFR